MQKQFKVASYVKNIIVIQSLFIVLFGISLWQFSLAWHDKQAYQKLQKERQQSHQQLRGNVFKLQKEVQTYQTNQEYHQDMLLLLNNLTSLSHDHLRFSQLLWSKGGKALQGEFNHHEEIAYLMDALKRVNFHHLHIQSQKVSNGQFFIDFDMRESSHGNAIISRE